MVSSKSDKTVFDLIEIYAKNAKWSKDEKNTFYQRLSSYLLYDKNALIFQLKRTELHDADKRSDERARKRLGLIRSAVLCGMPIDAFGVEEQDVFPLGKWMFSKQMYFPFNFEDEEFEKKYVEFMHKFLDNSCKELQMYDYLGRGDRDVPTRGLDEYFRAYRKIFDRIEEHLKKGMKYIRILGLRIQENTRDQSVDVSTLILRQCSPELFHHMCMCLNQYNTDQVQFYATNRLSRIYQFAINKDENYISVYEERYFLDGKGDAYPSFATTRLVEERKEMHFIYDKEISNHVTNQDDVLFSKDSFVKGFHLIIEQYRENGFSDMELRLRNGVKEIVNRKIKAYNKIFSKDATGEPITGWKDIPLFA